MNIDEILSTETNKGTTNSVSREELLAIAMKAISFGWSLIPVAKDKKPILNWKEFQFRRAPEEEVRGWFEKYPEVQLGVVTGEISNLTVVDMEEGADFSLIKDKTFKIKTGGNGIHWYFQYESDFKNAVRLLPLTDVRSEGGYCVTLGSTTSKGSYLALDDCPVAKMSQATKDLLLTGKRVASSSSINPKEMRELADIFLKVEVANYTGAGSGGRNDTMARFIGKLLNTVHPLKWDSDALPAILQANQKNTPPLPQNEVMATYESIKRSDVSNKLIKPQGSAPVAVQEEIDPEDEAIVLMSEAADKQKVDLSKFFPLGIEIFDKEIKGGVHYGDLITIAGMPGEGKCLERGTPVLMADGTIKKIESIKKGENVMGTDSTPRKVLGLVRGEDEMFEISQGYGDSYTVNKAHLLSLKRTNGGMKRRDNPEGEARPRKDRKGELLDISVEDYMKLSDGQKWRWKGYHAPVTFAKKRLLLDPYFMGLWLGDGHSSNTAVTTMDKEIVEYLEELSIKLNLKITKQTKEDNLASSFFLVNEAGKPNVLRNLLRHYKVFGNKNIPDDFKINSRDNQLQLLAGLIDSDGYVNRTGYVFVNKNKNLAEGFAFISRSLGFRATITSFVNKKYNKIYYKVGISGDCHFIPVKIEHKKVNIRQQKKNPLVSAIKVKPMGVGKYYGLTLDGDKRFLLGDFTVTHNSSWCMNLAKNFIGGGEKVLFFSYEMLIQMVWEKFALMGVKPSDQIYCPFKTVTGDVGWVENRIKEAKEKLGIKIIMIDHFSFLSGRKVLSKMSETESSVLTKIVKDIKEIAKQQEVIIFMPVHVRKQGQNYKKNEELTMDSIAHTAGVAQLSDLVFTIQREKHQDPAASDIYTGFTSISMVKNRWGHKNPRGYFEMINEQFIYNKEYNGINRPANVVHPAVAAEEVSPFPVQEVTKEEFTKDMEEDAVNSLFKGLIIKGQNQ